MFCHLHNFNVNLVIQWPISTKTYKNSVKNKCKLCLSMNKQIKNEISNNNYWLF